MKKILILYTNYGTGHYMAAKAIAEVLNKKNNYKVELFDPLTYSRPTINKWFAKSGKLFATKLRNIRGLYYHKGMYHKYLNTTWSLKILTKLFWTKKLEKKLLELNPNIIISTQVGPTGLIALHKEIIPCKLISVFTDYGVHKMYTAPEKYVDYFCVPSNDIKKEMQQIGIAKEKIVVTGIPVREKFFIKDKRDKKENNFLFVCGGGLGYSNAYSYFKELLKTDYEFTYTFVAGKNKNLLQTAKLLAKHYPKHKGKVIGYTNQMDELIETATLVLGKPGGIITSETLTLQTPIFALAPIPGQEQKNAKFIEKNGFGLYPKNKKEFRGILSKLNNKEINLNDYVTKIEKSFLRFNKEKIIKLIEE